MGLRDEFADAVDSIRDLQFHATRVSTRSIIESFFGEALYRFQLRVYLRREKCDHACSFTNSVWVQLTIPLRRATPDNNFL